MLSALITLELKNIKLRWSIPIDKIKNKTILTINILIMHIILMPIC